MAELQQTNLEKTLLAWCRQNSQVRPRCEIIYSRILAIIKAKFSNNIHKVKSSLCLSHSLLSSRIILALI